MGYHVTMEPREGERPISVEQMKQAIERIDGLTWSIFDDQTIHVNDGDGNWLLSIFETSGEWWGKTLDESQFDKFVAIADTLNCDVRGDEKELYRLVDGKVVMAEEPPRRPVSIWDRGSPWRRALMWTIAWSVLLAALFLKWTQAR